LILSYRPDPLNAKLCKKTANSRSLLDVVLLWGYDCFHMRKIIQNPGPTIPNVLLLLETSRHCTREILKGLVKYARFYGPWFFCQPTPAYRRAGGNKKSQLPETPLSADGAILCGPDVPARFLGRYPAVAIDVREKIPGIPNIVGDSKTIAHLASDYFRGLRLTHFAFCGFPDIAWSIERGELFRDLLAKAGFAVDIFQPRPANPTPGSARERQQLVRWLKSLPKPVGLFACNDDRGKDIIEACRLVQCRIPDDIAVLGVDNDPLVCELTDPPLSSIVLDFEKAGYQAAELLDRMMAVKTLRGQNIVISVSRIETRRSTDVLAIGDLQVLQAVRFIHHNASKPIQINDVALAAMLSRRTLFARFRAALDRTVHQEIRRVRTERIARLLLETDWPVYQIAGEMGFRSPEHIARFFKKEKGLTPAAFRRRFKKP
jgi:LacI family transcriptional regulator